MFIQRGFPVGGVETLTLRLADQLVERGFPVIVTGGEGEFAAALNCRVTFFPIADHVDLVRRLPEALLRRDGGPVILVSLHPMSLGVAAAVAGPVVEAGRDVRGFHLVSHSRAFFFGANWPGKRRLLRRYFRSSPRASTYFMNHAARDAHAAHWGEDLSDYPVMRLALVDAEPHWQRAGSGQCSIVSVGRLVPFKGYNLEAPGIVRALRDKGFDARWTIWGYGESEGEIRRRIERGGVGDFVTLGGALAYARLVDEVCQHDVFVGMGTAVLEAAAAGVPSICAVESHGDRSYGFLSETPLDSVGDVVAGVPMHDLLDDVSRFAAMDAKARASMSCADARSARERSASLDDMANAILGAAKWQVRPVDALAGRLGVTLEDWKERSFDRLRGLLRQ